MKLRGILSHTMMIQTCYWTYLALTSLDQRKIIKGNAIGKRNKINKKGIFSFQIYKYILSFLSFLLLQLIPISHMGSLFCMSLIWLMLCFGVGFYRWMPFLSPTLLFIRAWDRH